MVPRLLKLPESTTATAGSGIQAKEIIDIDTLVNVRIYTTVRMYRRVSGYHNPLEIVHILLTVLPRNARGRELGPADSDVSRQLSHRLGLGPTFSS